MRVGSSCLILILGLSGCSVSVATGAAVSVEGDEEVEPLNNEASPGTTAAWLKDARWWPARDRVFEKDGEWMIDVMVELTHEPPAGEQLIQLDWQLKTIYESVHAHPGAPPVVRPVPPDGVYRLKLRQRVDFQALVPVAPRRYQIPVKLPRKRGFQAGEYWLEVLHVASGVSLGTQQEVLLHSAAPSGADG